MSDSGDSGDKTRAGGGRGPLPRTNRPRPAPASQRVTVVAAPGAPQPARGATPGDEARPPPDAGAAASRPTTREAIEAPAPGGSGILTGLAERPTQLDTGPQQRPPGHATALRQVRLVRADGNEGESAGPATSYVGYVIDGRYRVEGVLGRGGMGVVYRARHEVIDKLAAIKILLPTEDPDVIERFVNEARAATAIGNAHIVDTVDFGALPDGSTYFVMEYLEGETLARRIKREKFLPVPAAVAMARQIAEGIGAAHRAGIVHRDLKPENIYLTKRDDQADFVKLLDFGIAKIQNAQNRITRAGTIFGTPHYMSPEQAAGTEVDPRTDLYALGVILYEMLTGRTPFDAENPMGLLTQHLYAEPVPFARLEGLPQELPRALDAIVLKCLAKQRADRYESAADLVLDLDRAERGDPPVAMADLLSRAERDDDRRLAAAARAAMRPRRKAGGKLRLVALLSAAALALGGGALVIALGEADPGPAPSAFGAVAELAAPLPSATPGPRRRMVSLVFSPIDGEVFRGGRSLGGMPVSVEVPPGQTVEVEVRRDGFYAERLVLDGGRNVVVARLAPIPGVEPRIPVPSGDPVKALRGVPDAGAVASTLLSARAVDAGRAASRTADAGAVAHAPAPAPSAGPSPEPAPSAAPVPPAAPLPPPAPTPAPAVSTAVDSNLTPPPGP